MKKNLILKTDAGDVFSTVAEKAKSWSTQHDCNVEFDFNGVTCVVNSSTNLEWLWRDYMNAHTMDWKTVGADCVEKYDEKTADELHCRQVAAEEKAEIQRQEYRKQEEREQAAFNEKVSGIEMEFSDKAQWDIYVEKNDDPYGACCVKYAEGWAKVMQVEIAKGKTIIGCAEKASHELGFLGITGFMYGAAVSMLARCWKHGEELRKWHNKEYNHEGEGVVNPAVLTISS